MQIGSSESREPATPGSSKAAPSPSPSPGYRAERLRAGSRALATCVPRAHTRVKQQPMSDRMGRGGRNHLLLGGELRPPIPDAPRSSPKLRKGYLPRQRRECVRTCGSSPWRQQQEQERSRGRVEASPVPPPRCWYVPTGSAPSHFPAPGPAWLPARARRPHRGPELPWPSGRRRRGSGSAGVRRPSPAAATRRTASLRSRQKMTPGPRR